MKILSTNAIVSAVIGTSFMAATSAYAKPSTCKFEGVPATTCQINHRQIKGGWKDEVLIEPNGPTRTISRDMRGEGVQTNLFALGQRKGPFHIGIHRIIGNKVVIYVDGDRFSYTL